jgi:hypothetical protein
VKLSYNLLFTLLFSFLLYSAGYSQNFAAADNHSSAASPQNPLDLVTVHYDGENAGNSVGDGGTTFIGGARFRASILGAYAGGELQSVQFFYAQDATGLALKIYDAGTPTAPGALLLSQALDLGSLTVGNWNEVALSTNIPISGNDLWVCLQVEDATTAAFPFGVDAGPADPDGDWVNDSGAWQHLNDFGLNYNWNIRGVVETNPVGIVTTIAGPEKFNLLQNYPNPFNPTTTITFSVPQSGKVRLAVYNLIGQEIAVLVNDVVSEGLHHVELNASSLSSGVYLYKLQQDNSVSIKKMTLLK